MRNLLNILLLSSFLSCSFATSSSRAPAEQLVEALPLSTPVTPTNSVSDCVTLSLGQPITIENLTVLQISLKLKKEVAECGCKSAALAYRVTEHTEASVQETYSGLVNMTPGNTEDMKRLLVMRTEPVVKVPTKFTLVLECRRPD